MQVVRRFALAIARPLFVMLVLLAAARAGDRLDNGTSQTRLAVDVCVYGAGSSGVIAAVAAAREGYSVALVEPSHRIGGLLASGFRLALDVPEPHHLSGLARDFYEKDVARHSGAYQVKTLRHYQGAGKDNVVALQSYLDRHRDRITVITHHRVAAVEVKHGAIQHVVFEFARADENGVPAAKRSSDSLTRVGAKVFIDASYEGDLMARSGVSYRVGRESRAQEHPGLPIGSPKIGNNDVYELLRRYAKAGYAITWPYANWHRGELMTTMTESDIHKDLRGNELRAPLHPDSVAIGVFGVSVPAAAIQDALVRQCSLLFFYKDQPCDAREFAAVQRLSLLGAVDSDASYQFHPDQPIELGDFARLAVRGLRIPPSITAPHFHDVPREHPAFKYIETLYNYSTQATQPFFSYHEHGRYPLPAQIFAFPEHAVTGRRAAQILSGLLQKNVQAPGEPDRFLTRGEAALLVDQLMRLAASPP